MADVAFDDPMSAASEPTPEAVPLGHLLAWTLVVTFVQRPTHG